MATKPVIPIETDAEKAIRVLGQEYVKHYNARDVEMSRSWSPCLPRMATL